MPVSYDKEERTIYLEGVIWAEDISAVETRKALKEIGSGELHVHLNCLGGDVWESVAITEAFEAHEGKIVTYNDGICASGGVDIYLLGDERKSAKRAEWMIHTAHTFIGGNHYDFDAAAKWLRETDQDREAFYRERLPNASEAIAEWFNGKDHFFRASTALETGILTEEPKSVGKAVDARAMVAACKEKMEQSQTDSFRRLSAELKEREPTVEDAKELFNHELQDVELRLRLARAK